MGCYIDTHPEDKRVFLIREGLVLQSNPAVADITPDNVLVCLIIYGPLTAAAVVHSASELAEYTRPDDRRPKLWFLVPREAVHRVSDLKNYE